MPFNEKYVTESGGGLHDGSSEANAWTLAEAASNMSAGDRINMKAGTYTISSAVEFSGLGSSTSPTSLRGYKTTIGDMDEGQTSQRVSGTDIPLIQVSGGLYFHWRNWGVVENIATEISSPSTHGIQMNPTGIVRRCRFTINGAPSSAYQACRTAYNNYTQFHDCSFSSPDNSASLCGGNRSAWYGCYFSGGINGVVGSAQTFVTNCVFSGQTGDSITFTYGFGPVESNTFYNIGGNAIDVDNSIGPTSIKNNVFHTVTGYAVSQLANDLECFAESNLYYNCTAGEFSNDSFSLRRNEITASTDPFTDVASNDFTLVSTSGGYNGAAPSPYDLLDVNIAKDRGAIQHADPSGGGTPTTWSVHPLRGNR